jgi:hypothetical protein
MSFFQQQKTNQTSVRITFLFEPWSKETPLRETKAEERLRGDLSRSFIPDSVTVRQRVPCTCGGTHNPVFPKFNFRTINPASAGGADQYCFPRPFGIPQGIKSDGVNISFSLALLVHPTHDVVLL